MRGERVLGKEASIDSELARNGLKLVGSLTRACIEDNKFVGLEEIFIFDLHLPVGFHPKPCDGGWNPSICSLARRFSSAGMSSRMSSWSWWIS